VFLGIICIHSLSNNVYVGYLVVVIARWDKRILIGEVNARLHSWDPGSKDTVQFCRALVDHTLVASSFIIYLGAVPFKS
jgi:hypothetical protein